MYANLVRGAMPGVPIVIGDKRLPEFPDSPAAAEFITDPAVKQELELMMVSQTYNRPMMAPPGTPAMAAASWRETRNEPELAASSSSVASACMRRDPRRSPRTRRCAWAAPRSSRTSEEKARDRIRTTAGFAPRASARALGR